MYPSYVLSKVEKIKIRGANKFVGIKCN